MAIMDEVAEIGRNVAEISRFKRDQQLFDGISDGLLMSRLKLKNLMNPS